MWHRIAASDSTLFFLGGRRAYYRPADGGEWKRARCSPRDLPFDETYYFLKPLILATEEAIYLGWDWGEFGGGLKKLQLVENDDELQLEPTGILIDEPVRGMSITGKGTVYIATALAHMGGLWAGLFRDDSSGIVALISQSNIKGSNGQMALPGDTDISGLAIGPDNAPYIVATSLGVFEVTGSSLKSVIQSDLRIEYRINWDIGSELIVGSRPQGLVVLDESTIAIATRSTGVLVFEKRNGEFAVRQILVPEMQES
jgi:hypothetical protein